MMRFLCLVLVLLPMGATSSETDTLEYAAHGPYTVGTRDIVIDGLDVAVWYPAVDEGEEATTYGPALSSVQGQAIRDAAPLPAEFPYPLVIFSHGSGAWHYLHTFLLEHLASHGFFVMAAAHEGNTIFDVLREESFIEAIPAQYVRRPQAIRQQFGLAVALNAEGDFAGLIDTERLALAGHSFGGQTVLRAAGAEWDFDALAEWCAANAGSELDPHPDAAVFPGPSSPEAVYGACFLLEERDQLAELGDLGLVPDALILMAPWNMPAFGEESLAEVEIPVLVMGGSVDHVTPPERDIYPAYEQLGSDSKAELIFREADHFIFMDECPDFLITLRQEWACSDPIWDMAEAHASIKHFSTVFLLAELYDDGDARFYLTRATPPENTTYRTNRL